jgi:hypothetical protein
MRRYRGTIDGKIAFGKLTEEARQVAQVRYSSLIVDAVRLNRAAAKKLLQLNDDSTDRLGDSSTDENAAMLAVVSKIFFETSKMIQQVVANTARDLNIGSGGSGVNINAILAGIYSGLVAEAKAMIDDPTGEGIPLDVLGPDRLQLNGALGDSNSVLLIDD